MIQLNSDPAVFIMVLKLPMPKATTVESRLVTALQEQSGGQLVHGRDYEFINVLLNPAAYEEAMKFIDLKSKEEGWTFTVTSKTGATFRMYDPDGVNEPQDRVVRLVRMSAATLQRMAEHARKKSE